MSSAAKRLTSLFNLSSVNLAEVGKNEPSAEPADSGARGRRRSISARLSRSQSRERSVSAQPQGSPEEPPVPPIPHGIDRQSTILSTYTDDGGELPPPPPVRVDSASRSSSRNSSRPNSEFRPASVASLRPESALLQVSADGHLDPGNAAASNKLKRKSIFGRSRKSEAAPTGPQAWIVGHDGKPEYNVAALQNAETVPELWDDQGDTYVYLYPRTSGRGPCFKVDSTIYASSTVLTQLAYGGIYSNPAIVAGERRGTLDTQVQNMDINAQNSSPVSPNTPRASDIESEDVSSKASRELMNDSLELPSSEIHLYLPLKLSNDGQLPTPGGSAPPMTPDDLETFIATRNMFAFLVGQSLVATPSRQNIFAIFLQISELLKHYEFSNLDGSTFGEIAAASFDSYVEELHLADVRASREKTIEGLVLGERMRSVMLYNEAFVHAVGKYAHIKDGRNSKFDMISRNTRDRMERASMDLEIRLRNFTARLTDFDFPGVFSGIMNSKSSEERKTIRFEAWRTAFMATRKHVMSYYKSKYGAWPPKANSKKNSLETDGLNRIVLQDLYHDFSCLYDLLVDRENLTTRTMDAASTDEDAGNGEPMFRALRMVLSEFDRSVPPFQPPVPFDCPMLPHLRLTRSDYGTGDEKKDTKARKKDLKDDEVAQMMKKTHNGDSDISTPFLDSFRQLEKSSMHRKNIEEIRDIRIGHWLFMYAVIQSLPMLVVDAPGVKWTKGVEYFLCEPPRSGVPWAKDVKNQGRAWYGIAGGSGVVSLPSDLVEHGVEGVYRRSHCWQMAEKWSLDQPGMGMDMVPGAVEEDINEPLPEPGMPRLRAGSRASSIDRRSHVRESVMLGLEALPLPTGVSPTGEIPRPVSSHSNDPTKTFDSIIGATPQKGKKREKSKLAS
ncbi:hypothetical protein GTA08_BOTSDO08187 [Neofusicoccum parvum]|uniref:Uncharacterized protein n=1 Tax=Neofusicoccum parvum TaxID=310453 RepID=A0ACB5S757_9PEZI|nr:hypothetical protein GTA08_BOTSDO08187 [Neofusicoccum parvum]GME58806.1 hypothetical protein GTA08_BOTSDO08187 [Neofusicoccum parvum]